MRPSLSFATVLLAASLATFPSVTIAQRSDPVTQDPQATDRNFLTANRAVIIPSAGARMSGVMLIAEGAGPHRVVVLLHGFPGYERNMDLAQTIRRAGWNVLTFQYRGAWGSEGSYSFTSVLEDVKAALAFVRASHDSTYRISSDHIVLIGHSMGGWAALMTAARDPEIDAVASIAGWNIGADSRDLTDSLKYNAEVKDITPFLWLLHGATADGLIHEQMTHVDEWDLPRSAPSLSTKSVLLIAGQRDVGLPIARHHAPLVAELKRLKATRLTTAILDSDHWFTDKRLALSRTVISWLDTQAMK